MTLRIEEEDLALLRSIRISGVKRPRRINVARKLEALRRRVRKEAHQHMQPWIVLLEESINYFVVFEELQHSRRFTKTSAAFAMQLAKLRSLAISVRELVLLGQDVPAHALTRVFLEEIELTFVMMDDPDFAQEFMDEVEDHDEEAFWRSNIGYGRIYKRLHAALVRGGWSESAADDKIQHHKASKNALAAAVHPSQGTTFRAMAIPSFVHPGLFAIRTLGELSAHTPRVCLFISMQTQEFASTATNLMISPNPPAVLAGYRGKARKAGVGKATLVLQDLLHKYGEDMHKYAEYVLDQI